MAYSFPLPAAQFMDILPIELMTFDLPEVVEISRTAGGDVMAAELGTRLWRGEVRLGPMTVDEEAEVTAMIDVLRRAAGSFLCYDARRPWPRADFQGLALAGHAPTLASVAANAREVTLGGLPAGYQIQRGDMLGFSYASAPTRYAVHRAASPAAAQGNGITTLFEVSPSLRPGWAIGAAITLIRPTCKAIILPGSYDAGQRKRTTTTGVAFKFLQTLR